MANNNSSRNPAPQGPNHTAFYVVCGVALLTGLLMFLGVPYAWVIGLAIGLVALLAAVSAAGVTHVAAAAAKAQLDVVQLQPKGLLTVIPEKDRSKFLERPAGTIVVRRNTVRDEEDPNAWSTDNVVVIGLVRSGDVPLVSLGANMDMKKLEQGSIIAPILVEPFTELAEAQFLLRYTWPSWIRDQREQNTATENVKVDIALRYRPRIPHGAKRPATTDLMKVCMAEVTSWDQLVKDEAFHQVQEQIRSMDPNEAILHASSWGSRAAANLNRSLEEYGLEANLRIEAITGVASRDKAETEAMKRAEAAGWVEVAREVGKTIGGFKKP